MSDRTMLEQIERWQSSPEGNAYLSVRDLDSAVTSIEELCMTREGVRFVRSEALNIAASVRRLQDILASIQPVFVAAAE